MRALRLFVPLCLFSTLAMAQPQNILLLPNKTPTAAPSASAQTARCLALTDVKNSMSPPTLYQGAVNCIAQNQYTEAAQLFAVASVYAQFDTERVADKTAAQAKPALQMAIFAKTSKEQKAQFDSSMKTLTTTPTLMAELCQQINHIGKPAYYPQYMIAHGMANFTGGSTADALVKDFDAAATWQNLQTNYLHCPTAG